MHDCNTIPKSEDCIFAIHFTQLHAVNELSLSLVALLIVSDVSAKLSITKTCTKNVSCELQVNATARVKPCDQSQNSWVCTSCCYENACNVNTAQTAHAVTPWIKLSLFVFVCFMKIHLSPTADCISFHSTKSFVDASSL